MDIAYTGIILGMVSANDRRRYIVTPSLIVWAHTQNDPYKHHRSVLESNPLTIRCIKMIMTQITCGIYQFGFNLKKNHTSHSRPSNGVVDCEYFREKITLLWRDSTVVTWQMLCQSPTILTVLFVCQSLYRQGNHTRSNIRQCRSDPMTHHFTNID